MPETADRTESLFSAAAARPPEEREYGSDKRMRRRCRAATGSLALLKAGDRPGHMLDRPVDVDSDQNGGTRRDERQPGTIIAGRYKLLEEIGQRKGVRNRKAESVPNPLSAPLSERSLPD